MVGELSYSVFFCGSPTILQNVQKHGWLIVIFCLFLWSPHNIAVCTKTWLGNCHILCLFSVVPPLVRPSTHPCQKSEPMQIWFHDSSFLFQHVFLNYIMNYFRTKTPCTFSVYDIYIMDSTILLMTKTRTKWWSDPTCTFEKQMVELYQIWHPQWPLTV